MFFEVLVQVVVQRLSYQSSQTWSRVAMGPFMGWGGITYRLHKNYV